MLLSQNHVYFASIVFASGVFWFFSSVYLTNFYCCDRKEFAITHAAKIKSALVGLFWKCLCEECKRKAQGFISLFRTECELQSLLLVGGCLLLLNFLITFSTGASFPFDVVQLSLVLIQGECLISHGDLEGFILRLFLSTFITLTTDKEPPCPSRVRNKTSGVRAEQSEFVHVWQLKLIKSHRQS